MADTGLFISSIPIYVLAGGHSRRFGGDKARAELDGTPLIRRIANALAPVSRRTVVVADQRGKYADLGLTTISDHKPGLGPLGGLATALADLRQRDAEREAPYPQGGAEKEREGGEDEGGWLLLTSCDWVDVRLQWAQCLIHTAEEAEREVRAGQPRRAAVVFRGDWPEPLFALYHASIQPVVHEQLLQGQRAMWRLLERLNPVELPLPKDWPAVPQVNTPEELDQARTQLTSSLQKTPRHLGRQEYPDDDL